MSAIPFTSENVEKIRRVGDRMLGSCSTLDDKLQEEFGDEDLTLEDFDILLLHELDDIAMECEECGWWCEPGVFGGDDQICEDCMSE